MSAHWSRDLATLWWRDKGTGRVRVSFHSDVEKLKEKYVKLYHDNIDAALWTGDGTRIPLSALPAGGPKKKRKKKAPDRTEPEPPPAAA